MVKPLPEGCLLTALADCCHSGTVLDLPYSYNISGSIESIEEMDKYNKELSKEYLSNESYQKNSMYSFLLLLYIYSILLTINFYFIIY